MLKRLLFTAFLLSGYATKAQYVEYEPLPRTPAPAVTYPQYTPSSPYLKYAPATPYYYAPSSQTLEDGWYSATVNYVNTGTSYKAKYTLKVKVVSDRVTVIDFGDGSVHSGTNNSGYYYNGGSLEFKRDYDGELVSAITKVTITDNDIAYKIFYISLH